LDLKIFREAANVHSEHYTSIRFYLRIKEYIKTMSGKSVLLFTALLAFSSWSVFFEAADGFHIERGGISCDVVIEPDQYSTGMKFAVVNTCLTNDTSPVDSEGTPFIQDLCNSTEKTSTWGFSSTKDMGVAPFAAYGELEVTLATNYYLSTSKINTFIIQPTMNVTNPFTIAHNENYEITPEMWDLDEFPPGTTIETSEVRFYLVTKNGYGDVFLVGNYENITDSITSLVTELHFSEEMVCPESPERQYAREVELDRFAPDPRPYDECMSDAFGRRDVNSFLSPAPGVPVNQERVQFMISTFSNIINLRTVTPFIAGIRFSEIPLNYEYNTRYHTIFPQRMTPFSEKMVILESTLKFRYDLTLSGVIYISKTIDSEMMFVSIFNLTIVHDLPIEITTVDMFFVSIICNPVFEFEMFDYDTAPGPAPPMIPLRYSFGGYPVENWQISIKRNDVSCTLPAFSLLSFDWIDHDLIIGLILEENNQFGTLGVYNSCSDGGKHFPRGVNNPYYMDICNSTDTVLTYGFSIKTFDLGADTFYIPVLGMKFFPVDGYFFPNIDLEGVYLVPSCIRLDITPCHGL
jgi:hypothetical protein